LVGLFRTTVQIPVTNVNIYKFESVLVCLTLEGSGSQSVSNKSYFVSSYLLKAGERGKKSHSARKWSSEAGSKHLRFGRAKHSDSGL